MTFEHVGFSYVPDRKLLQDICIEAKPGMRFALVGPTGCGKTTLINLLLRFYDIDAGRIAVDGRSSRDYTRSSLRRAFGMVLQDTWLFEGTVADNIAYGSPDATREQVIEAAKRAHAHKFIVQLPKGYDTVIGEDGGTFSQGQKQLLCIARVMLTDPAILLLDEGDLEYRHAHRAAGGRLHSDDSWPVVRACGSAPPEATTPHRRLHSG